MVTKLTIDYEWKSRWMIARWINEWNGLINSGVYQVEAFSSLCLSQNIVCFSDFSSAFKDAKQHTGFN